MTHYSMAQEFMFAFLAFGFAAAGLFCLAGAFLVLYSLGKVLIAWGALQSRMRLALLAILSIIGFCVAVFLFAGGYGLVALMFGVHG